MQLRSNIYNKTEDLFLKDKKIKIKIVRLQKFLNNPIIPRRVGKAYNFTPTSKTGKEQKINKKEKSVRHYLVALTIIISMNNYFAFFKFL